MGLVPWKKRTMALSGNPDTARFHVSFSVLALPVEVSRAPPVPATFSHPLPGPPPFAAASGLAR